VLAFLSCIPTANGFSCMNLPVWPFSLFFPFLFCFYYYYYSVKFLSPPPTSTYSSSLFPLDWSDAHQSECLDYCHIATRYHHTLLTVCTRCSGAFFLSTTQTTVRFTCWLYATCSSLAIDCVTFDSSDLINQRDRFGQPATLQRYRQAVQRIIRRVGWQLLRLRR
jgi:hypothetical protein